MPFEAHIPPPSRPLCDQQFHYYALPLLDDAWLADSSFDKHPSSPFLPASSSSSTGLPCASVAPTPPAAGDVQYDWPPVSLSPAVSFLSSTSLSLGSSELAIDSSGGSSNVVSSLPSPSLPSLQGSNDVSVVGEAAVRLQARRRLCKRACVPCRNAKTACDESRPCSRCRTQRDPALCCDRPGDEIERGRHKRRRKPNNNKNNNNNNNNNGSSADHTANQLVVAEQQLRPSVSPHYELPSPYPSVALRAPGRDQLHMCQASAHCLAAAQSTQLRQFLFDIAGQLQHVKALNAVQRAKAIRALHIGLAHMADHMSLHHFNTFFQGHTTAAPSAYTVSAATNTSSAPPDTTAAPRTSAPSSASSSPPSSPAPLSTPAFLLPWMHPTTRPLFLEWSLTPAMCVSSTEEPADAAKATVRVRFLMSARDHILGWEGRQHNPAQLTDASMNSAIRGERSTVKTDRQTEQAAEEFDISQINANLSCLSMEEPPVSSSTSAADTVCPHRSHASWCVSQRPLPSDPLSDSSSPLCSCADSVSLPCVMVVNAAWERLFGWSQQEVRSDLLRYGMGAEALWYRLDSWFAYHVLLDRHWRSDKIGSDFRTFVIVRSKWGAELSCIMNKKLVCGEDGFTSATVTFTPVSGPTTPPAFDVQ